MDLPNVNLVLRNEKFVDVLFKFVQLVENDDVVVSNSFDFVIYRPLYYIEIAENPTDENPLIVLEQSAISNLLTFLSFEA